MHEAEGQLRGATAREEAAVRALAALETTDTELGQELATSDRAVTDARETAHQRELDLERRQQRIDFDRRRMTDLERAVIQGGDALAALEARREPAHAELDTQRTALTTCRRERDAAEGRLDTARGAYAEAQRVIEGREGDVEAARSEVFAAINAATALQNVVDNASAGATRVAAALSEAGVGARRRPHRSRPVGGGAGPRRTRRTGCPDRARSAPGATSGAGGRAGGGAADGGDTDPRRARAGA